MQVGSWSSSSLTKLEREEFKIYYRKKIADVFCILFVCNFLRSVRIIFFFRPNGWKCRIKRRLGEI